MRCWPTSNSCATAIWKSISDYLLDTNHASSLMAGEEPLVGRVRQAEGSGDRFALSITVLGEL